MDNMPTRTFRIHKINNFNINNSNLNLQKDSLEDHKTIIITGLYMMKRMILLT